MTARTETRTNLMETFAAYREANDARLAALERGRPDTLLEEKVARIDADLARSQERLDRLARGALRPPVGAPAAGGGGVSDGRKSAFARFLRAGTAPVGEDQALEAKALSGTTAEGGALAPPELETAIARRITATSAMRQIASVRTVGAATFRKPTAIGRPAAAWVSETAARPETAAPPLALMDFPTLETYAMPAATQALLDDAHVNLEDWLAGEAEDAFAAQESEAFIGGDGTTRPKGVLAYETVDDAAHVWGKLGRRTSGVAGGLPAGGAGADVLVDLVASLKTAFRPGARFVMGRRMAALVRKLKDTSGGYLWQPGMEGAGASLLGYPVTEMDEMPDPAAGARALVFGDFQRGYLVVDRAGVRVLRDPYSAKPHVLFYMTRRVGGGVQNFDALKVLELSA